MTIAMSNGASGASFQQAALEVATNNIASMGRAGFKEELMLAASNDYIQELGVGSVSSSSGNIIPAGVQKGQGVRPLAVVSKLSQGRLERTDNPYHVAVQGKGFFQVEMPDGTIGYTRDGTFTVNHERRLVNQRGDTVAPAITIPDTAEFITISSDGKVQAKVSGQVAFQELGTIELATFSNEEGLRKIDNNLLLETAASGNPIIGAPGSESRGSLLQGHFEGSNVDMVSQVTKLIKIQRAYEMNIKSIKAQKEILETNGQI